MRGLGFRVFGVLDSVLRAIRVGLRDYTVQYTMPKTPCFVYGFSTRSYRYAVLAAGTLRFSAMTASWTESLHICKGLGRGGGCIETLPPETLSWVLEQVAQASKPG